MKRNKKLGINKALRSARLDDKNWTQEELARKADVSAQTVRKAESGNAISDVCMAKIAKALGRARKDIFGDDGELPAN